MRARVPLAVALVMVLSATTLHANTLATARDLYASASYNEALTVLEGLLSDSQPRDERRSIATYRILCLVALGRTIDTDRAMESLVLEDPLYRPATDLLSPRMLTAFAATRQRMLPGIIQQQYNMAKFAFDSQQFETAAVMFKQVLDMMADADMAEAVSKSPLSDLRTLAGGFHDLSVKAAAPPLPPPVVMAAPAPAVAAAPLRDYKRIYTSGDPDVVAPVTVRQQIPAFNGRLTQTMVGVIEVTINAAGMVEATQMVTSVHPQYDRTVLNAAARWQYQPATIDGVPVKFTKRVQITLTPPPAENR
jgi:TonB family protein